MKLKDYQIEVLATFSGYLQVLSERLKAYRQTLVALESSALPADLRPAVEASVRAADPLAEAWAQAQATLGTVSRAWTALTDGTGAVIPSVCLKLPTGGGKTLIAANAVERLHVDWLRRQTGLVLWVVPSQAIYAQTLAALKNRESAIRRTLDRASAGRVRILEKSDVFTRADTEGRLCVLVLMLQAARRQDETVLKMFQGGGDVSFFPDETDKLANDAARATNPNLDVYDLADGPSPGSIRRTLANVIRLLRPVIVLDEAHNAMTTLGHRVLSTLNPRFILELTATPTEHSNVLVDVKGRALRDEEMIKLPINVAVDVRGQWQATLRAALDTLNALDAAAAEHHGQAGDYIRPMMVVRVDHTGAKTRQQPIHVEDALEWLVQHGGVPPEVIRRQTAEKKELAAEDLMSPLTNTRIIITKDALREGWDAPFAYVLAILSSAGSATALTQFIGRVLRQPYARRTNFTRNGISLDEAYVFCTETSVGTAVQRINSGLLGEGMGDLQSAIRATEIGGVAPAANRITITRAERFRSRRILLPRVLHADAAVEDGWRDLDYESDLLSELDWEGLSWSGASTYVLAPDGGGRHVVSVDLGADDRAAIVVGAPIDSAGPGADLNRPDLIRRLGDVVPNPWRADAILGVALGALRGRGATDADIAVGRLTLLDTLRGDLQAKMEAAAKAVFQAKIADGRIVFRLSEPPLPQALRDALASGDAAKLLRDDLSELVKPLYTPVLTAEVNGLEASVARYLDDAAAVGWWWRVAARRDQVGLQGWRPHKVYPDFLVSLEADGRSARLLMLETKGEHLFGNADTEFKRQLFSELEAGYAKAMAVGQMELFEGEPEAVKFEICVGSEDLAWRAGVQAALA